MSSHKFRTGVLAFVSESDSSCCFDCSSFLMCIAALKAMAGTNIVLLCNVIYNDIKMVLSNKLNQLQSEV